MVNLRTGNLVRHTLRFQAQESTPPKNSPLTQNSTWVEQARLVQDVKTLTQWPRHSLNLPALNQAADYIQKEWEKLGLSVETQAFTLNGKAYKNLMVSFGPPDAERFIVGAHYDVFGENPGADDNASGVSGILELARILKKQNPTFKKRLDLVAYTLEEQPNPLTGSTRHAEWIKKMGVPVKGMVSLEMIGFFSDKPNSQTYPAEEMRRIYPNTGNFIGVVGYANGFSLVQEAQQSLKDAATLPVRSIYAPSNVYGLDRSDHASYLKVGIPAIMITDTANYRNLNYHQKSDTIDTLDFSRMAQVIQGVYQLIKKICD